MSTTVTVVLFVGSGGGGGVVASFDVQDIEEQNDDKAQLEEAIGHLGDKELRVVHQRDDVHNYVKDAHGHGDVHRAEVLLDGTEEGVAVQSQHNENTNRPTDEEPFLE